MRAGRLRHTVTVQRKERAPDTFGEAVETYVDVVPKTRAGIEPLRGREATEAGRTIGEVTHRIVMRYQRALADISPDWRIVFGARLFDIKQAIDIEERGRELEIMATERRV